VLGLTARDLFPQKPQPIGREAAYTNAAPAVQPRPLGQLLDAICGYLRRYVVFQSPEQPEAIALWTLHTWLFNAFDYTVYLFIYSASMRSGKTRVLEVLELLCRKPEMTPGASAAALIRSGDEENPPTLLLDEMDTVYSKRNDTEAENTRRFLNAGYKRGAKFMKCVGQGADISVKKFPAFCPKALAGIDRCLPDTVLDRSLPIELVRQSRQEKAERLRDREAKAVTAPLRAELEALAQQPGVIESLRNARPEMPSELHDRAQDISEPLAAIADLAGGEWPEKGRAALVKLFSGQEEETDINVKLLADIKRVFDDKEGDKLTTKGLLDALVAIEDGAPWAQWWSDALNHDKVQIAASSLARKLKRYKIKPRTIKIDGHEESAKGYHRADFESVWKRYLPSLPQQAVTAVTAVTHEGKKVTATAPVTANSGNSGAENSRNLTATDEQAVTGICLGKKTKSYEVTAGDGHLNRGGEQQATTAKRDNADHDCLTCTDGCWHLCDACEAEFNAGKTMYPFDCPEWVRLYPEETSAHWQRALKQALAKACEVCEERLTQEPYIWFHLADGVGQCANCRESQWWADGYEINEYGVPSCWDHEHSHEQRIAERELAMLEKATKEWRESEEGRGLLDKARHECERLGVRPFRKIRRNEHGSVVHAG
jgi:hypothetical protein